MCEEKVCRSCRGCWVSSRYDSIVWVVFPFVNRMPHESGSDRLRTESHVAQSCVSIYATMQEPTDRTFRLCLIRFAFGQLCTNYCLLSLLFYISM